MLENVGFLFHAVEYIADVDAVQCYGNIELAEYDISSGKEYKELLQLILSSFRLGGRMMLESK